MPPHLAAWRKRRHRRPELGGDDAHQLQVFEILDHGAHPQPELRIACAARAAVSLGVQHDEAAIGSITSLQQFILFASLEGLDYLNALTSASN